MKTFTYYVDKKVKIERKGTNPFYKWLIKFNGVTDFDTDSCKYLDDLVDYGNSDDNEIYYFSNDESFDNSSYKPVSPYTQAFTFTEKRELDIPDEIYKQLLDDLEVEDLYDVDYKYSGFVILGDPVQERVDDIEDFIFEAGYDLEKRITVYYNNAKESLKEVWNDAYEYYYDE